MRKEILKNPRMLVVSEETKHKLNSLGDKGDRYEDIILRLINGVKK